MKSLLYKEFAVSKKLLIFLGFYYILGGILAGLGGGMTVACYACMIVVATLGRSRIEEEKSGWDKYSAALPHTAFQRVGAKYLFCFLVLLMMVITVLLTGAVTNLITNEYQTLETLFKQWMPLYFSLLVFFLSIFLISLSVILPAGFAAKGTIVLTLVSMVSLPPFFVCYLLNNSLFSSVSARLKINLFSSIKKPQIAAMVIASAFLLFAASYFISVIIETKSGREKLKAVKTVAAVLTVAALAVSGATVYALDKDGAFEKKNNNGYILVENPDGGTVEKDNEKDADARSRMMKITEHICGKTYTGARTEEFYAELEQAGFSDCLVEFKDFNKSEKPVRISPVIYGTGAYTGGSTFTNGFKVKAEIAPNAVSAVVAEMKARELDALFFEGMSEESAVAAMKENDLCPFMIREVLAEEKICRTYSFSVIFSDEARSSMSMSFDIVDGKVCNKWNSHISERY